MVSVMKAVEDKKMTISAKFFVLRKTLDDRLKGHLEHEKKPGVDRVLTVEEEAGLAATVHPEDLASDQDTGIMKDPGSVLQGSSESSRARMRILCHAVFPDKEGRCLHVTGRTAKVKM